LLKAFKCKGNTQIVVSKILIVFNRGSDPAYKAEGCGWMVLFFLTTSNAELYDLSALE
jgi:hypothetical protein